MNNSFSFLLYFLEDIHQMPPKFMLEKTHFDMFRDIIFIMIQGVSPS